MLSSAVSAGATAVVAQYNNLRLDAARILALGTTELTIASGVITVGTDGFYYVDTQGDASTDDLDTINGGSAGDVLILRIAAAGRSVVVKHNTGNIYCAKDITLNSIFQAITLRYDGAISKWIDCDPDYLPRTGGIISGHVGVGGSSSIDATVVFLVRETTLVTSGNFFGLYSSTSAGPAGTSTTQVYGAYLRADVITPQTVAGITGARYYTSITPTASGATVTLMSCANLYTYSAAGTTGTITNCNGIIMSGDFGDVNVGTLYGIQVAGYGVTNGVITTYYGVYIGQPTTPAGTGSYTNVNGLYIIEPTRGAAVNKAITISGTSGTTSGGIWWSSDTVLYRGAANVLKTDDMLLGVYSNTTTSTTVYGFTYTLTAAPASASTGSSIAILGDAIHNSGNNVDSVQGGNFLAHKDTTNGGTITTLRGVRSAAYGSAGVTGTVTNLQGWYVVTDAKDLTVTGLIALYVVGPQTNNGVVTTSYAGYFGNGAVSGAGSITNQYGVYIAEQTLGATKYALYLAGTSYGLGSAISFNGQVNMYLGAANSLYIAGNVVRIVSANTGDNDIFQIFSNADQIFQVDGRGDVVAMKAKEYGFVCRDRATDAYRRIVSTNGTLSTEAM